MQRLLNATDAVQWLQSRVTGALHMVAAVGGGARPGDEAVASLDAAAVAMELPPGRAHPLCHPAGRFTGVVQAFHQNDSSTPTTICGLTFMSGCRPIMRRVCCTVVLNTGAATSPP